MLTSGGFSEAKEKGFAHLAILAVFLLVVLAIWIFVSKPWQKNLPATPQESGQKSQYPTQQPQTNPFEVKTNPFKGVKTNPFD